MREIRPSGSVEGVMGNHDSYSDQRLAPGGFTLEGSGLEPGGPAAPISVKHPA